MATKRTLSRSLLYFLVFLGVLVTLYGAAYFRMLQVSEKYWIQGSMSFSQGNFAWALKGARKTKSDGSGYEFWGGFQQVVEIWSSPFAWPRPDLYGRAQEQIRVLIEQKLDAESGLAIFQKYYQKDKRYLDAVLSRVATLDVQAGRLDEARKVLQTLIEYFPNDPETVAGAEKRLKALEGNP